MNGRNQGENDHFQCFDPCFLVKSSFLSKIRPLCCGLFTVSFRTDRVGKRPGQADPIETLYHADKARTEDCILELVVWLHHLVSQSNRPAMQKATDQGM